jgi:hypothetical protein
MKHSLEEIDIGYCGVSKKDLREILSRHGFTNIKEIDDE